MAKHTKPGNGQGDHQDLYKKQALTEAKDRLQAYLKAPIAGTYQQAWDRIRDAGVIQSGREQASDDNAKQLLALVEKALYELPAKPIRAEEEDPASGVDLSKPIPPPKPPRPQIPGDRE
jgi:hypothetical protein